jgi:hypothetical protein
VQLLLQGEQQLQLLLQRAEQSNAVLVQVYLYIQQYEDTAV